MAAEKDLRADGMYPDGSNPEGVDPVPPLQWRSKNDFKDVVVYGVRASPAVTKLLAYLRFYDIPFTYKPGFGKKGSKYYTKMPVLDVGGRQVNDTFIQLRHMVPALVGSFDEAWENKITYQYQMSSIVLSTEEFTQVATVKHSDFPIPSCLLCLVTNFLRPKGIKKLQEQFDDPNHPYQKVDLTEFAKTVAASMGSKPFFHGSTPGHVDISFYGVNAIYLHAEVQSVMRALTDAGLMPWVERMKQKIPLRDAPNALFQ